jgi:hypothetical protein
VWDGDVRLLRLEYLCSMAHLFHVTPPMTGDLRVLEFAVLLRGCDEYERAATPPG